MNQHRSNVSGRVILLQQSIEQIIVSLVFAFLERFAQGFGENCGAFAFHFFSGRNPFTPNPTPGETLDVFQPVNFATSYEGDGLAAFAGATGSSNPMDVIFAV